MKKLLSVLFAGLLIFTACSDNNKDKNDNDSSEIELKYPKEVDNGGKAVSGARLQYGLVSDTPFAGTLNTLWYEGNPDAVVMQFMNENLYNVSVDNTFEPEGGAANYKMSDDGLVKTITLRDDLYWHDGEKVTVDDIIFAYKVLADPNYTGVRFTSPHNIIEGIKDVKDGKAEAISGIKKVDELTLEITYTAATDEYLYVQEYILPEHIFSGMDVRNMATSDAVRKNPIGFGPFKVTSIVPGEAVTYEAYDKYWRGKAKIAGVDLKVVNSNVLVEALNSGEFDLVSSFPTSGFDENYYGDNVNFVSNIEGAYTYLGFKLGHWDAALSKNVVDPNMKMSDVNLRQAMGYAMDNATVGKHNYDGLRVRANSIIGPMYPSYWNKELEGYTYDPKKAKEILDEAGYKDVDGDGFRETPDGEQLVINFASMSGAGAEDLANFYIQNWKDVGLNVKLTDGRLIEFNSFYDLVGNDDPSVDIYQAAWSTGFNPNPEGLYGETAQFNFPRYTDEKWNEIIANINSEKALFDEDAKKKYYDEWQQYMFENPSVIPTLYRSTVGPVNKRVKFYDVEKGNEGLNAGYNTHLLELTAEKPIVATNK